MKGLHLHDGDVMLSHHSGAGLHERLFPRSYLNDTLTDNDMLFRLVTVSGRRFFCNFALEAGFFACVNRSL